jgi:hypothetical protein
LHDSDCFLSLVRRWSRSSTATGAAIAFEPSLFRASSSGLGPARNPGNEEPSRLPCAGRC